MQSSSLMRIQRLIMFLEAHFGKVELYMPDEPGDVEDEAGEERESEPWLIVRLDDVDAKIDLLSLVRLPHLILCLLFVPTIWHDIGCHERE